MIVVIGILFAVLISRVDFASDDAKATGAMTDLRSFQTAAHAIALKHNGFDSDLETLANQLNTKLDAELQLSVSGNKLVSAATDPWGTPYEVTVAGNTLMAASAGKNASFKSTDDMLTKVQGVTSADGFDVVVNTYTEIPSISFESLENASWAEISEVSASGLAPYVYSLGETKVVNDDWTVQIADFDHDDLADGSGKAGITFVSLKSNLAREWAPDVFAETHDWSYTYGGWAENYTRAYLNGTFYNTLSSDLKAVIRPVSKISDSGDGNIGDCVITEDKIWVPSVQEMGLAHQLPIGMGFANNQEKAYAIYTDLSSRVVLSDIDAYDTNYYLLRNSHDSNYFYAVINNDYRVSYGEQPAGNLATPDNCYYNMMPGTYTERLVAPGFCI